MLSRIRTKVLVRKDHYRDNKVNFIRPNPLLGRTSRVFINDAFKSIPRGEYAEVIFRITAKTRYYVGHKNLGSPVSYTDWVVANFTELYDQADKTKIMADETLHDMSLVVSIETYMDKLKEIKARETGVEDTSDTVDISGMSEEELEEVFVDSIFDEETKVFESYNPWHDKVYVDQEIAEVFKVSQTVAMNEHPVNLMMIGPSGYGKTTVPEAIAKSYGMNFIRINCAAVRDPEEWFGYREARGGDTVFIPSEFTKAVVNGNAVIVLDEFNRVEPWLHNTLYPLLDHARKTMVHGELIECGPNVIFVATANIGYQFVGTFMLDAAISNRMDAIINVGPLPRDVEVKVLTEKTSIKKDEALQIITHIMKLRDLAQNGKLTADVSTRTSLKIATFVSNGLSLKQAFKFVLLNSMTVDDAKIAIDSLHIS